MVPVQLCACQLSHTCRETLVCTTIMLSQGITTEGIINPWWEFHASKTLGYDLVYVPSQVFSLFLLFGRRRLLAFIDFTPSRRNHDVTDLAIQIPQRQTYWVYLTLYLSSCWLAIAKPPNIKATALTSKKSLDFLSSFSIPTPQPFQPLTALHSWARASWCPSLPFCPDHPRLADKEGSLRNHWAGIWNLKESQPQAGPALSECLFHVLSWYLHGCRRVGQEMMARLGEVPLWRVNNWTWRAVNVIVGRSDEPLGSQILWIRSTPTSQ